MPILKFIGRLIRYFWHNYLPNKPPNSDFSETREKITLPIREIKTVQKAKNLGVESAKFPDAYPCPYCSSKNTVKRGLRKKKYEIQQRYLCNDCQRSFVPQKVKGKSFPLSIILEGLSFYNTGFTLEESCQKLKEQFGIEVKSSTLSDWVKEFEPICRYARLRSLGLKLFSPNQIIQTVHLFHRQVYDFSVHRAKLAFLLQEHKHAKFENLREFLEAIQTECPHQFFQEGERGSEVKAGFDLSEVILKGKQNFATRIAGLVLQAVNDNKLRHKAMQRFMLCNDSVTVAVEVPVYMDSMDIEHMEEALGFKIPIKVGNSGRDSNSMLATMSANVITGHIDILQIRNGAVHILDYKPNASVGKKKATISQLTIYALALSRLTGLRLYDFKCAWFDENNYYEFFPLHVVYKLRQKVKKDDPGQMKFPLPILETEVSEQNSDNEAGTR